MIASLRAWSANDPNIAKIMRFGTPVVIDGKKSISVLTVKVSYQKRKEMGKPAVNEEVPWLYSLELDEIVRLGGQLKRLEYLQQNASSPSSEEIVTNFNAKVNEYFDNVSKIVDENGEPKVMCHGSPVAGIREFEMHKAVRAGLKARLNVLQSAGRLNKKESVSKELGVKVKAPKDALRLIERIAMLDAAYDRLDYELGIPAKVEAWDGKSAVPTKLDELEAKGTGVSYSLVSAEMEQFAGAFHEVERAAAVEVKCAEVYVEDIKAARDAAMPIYDALRAEPVAMKDGRVVSFTRKGFKEVLRHAADRRVLASFAKMRELAGKAVYLGAAPNSQKNVLSKSAIKEFHYYLSKGNYPDFAAWREQRGDATKASGDAYVVIVVAEGENGAAFYDLDATDYKKKVIS